MKLEVHLADGTVKKADIPQYNCLSQENFDSVLSILESQYKINLYSIAYIQERNSHMN